MWPRGLIQSKVHVPSVATHAIERPRVLRELRRAASARAVLAVAAPAGSGKTTAVAQMVSGWRGPVAWLTLGQDDATPGRLVTYLAAAVRPVDDAVAESTLGLLADGLSPADCAATLAERLPGGCVVVLDDLHQVEAHAGALRVLRATIEALAPGALLILVSRRIVHLDLSRDILSGRAAAVPQDLLAFRPGEVAALLEARGLDADAAAVARASSGWAAGLVFDALRGTSPPTTGAEDPFFSYLGSEVMDALPAELRGPVLRSALLDVVTPARLAALLDLDRATGEVLVERICGQRLPGIREPDGLRYHPRFREFLLDRLSRELPDEVADLTLRYGRTLMGDGLFEEAADHLVAAGEHEEAADAVEAAAPALMRRGDWEKLLAWCAALGEPLLARRPALRGLQVRSLLMGRRQEDVAPVVDTIRRTGEFDRHLAESPDVAAWATWALHGSGDMRPLLALAPPASASRRAHAVRYILEVCAGDDPPPEWDHAAFDRVQPLHVALQSAVYYRGRLAEVERLAWAAAGRGPVTATLAKIYRIAALRVRGDLGEARAALEATAPRVRESRFIEFWQQVEAELAFDEGRHEEGLRLIRAARATSRHHGYRLADRAVFATIEGRMLMRMGRLPEALELLEMTRAWCDDRSLGCFREWADTWLAAALLAIGSDGARAHALLTDAVAGMRRADRRLELVPALVLLAEARWRAGDEEGHDAAADDAHREAVAMGTLGPLLSALSQAPDVLARRLDAVDPDDDVWHALAWAIGAPGRPVPPAGAALTVATMGRAALLGADGEPIPVSPPRAVELAAAIARAGAAGADREELADQLVDDSADPANYLRQLVHRLRRSLPEGIALTSRRGRLHWDPLHAVVAEDQILEATVLRARRQVGAARAASLARALEIAVRGPYLPGADGAGAVGRRRELDALLAEARREHSRGSLRAGRVDEALRIARQVVEEDPYREDGWQLLMRAEAAAGGPAAVPPVFAECARRLAELGLAPSQRTRSLLERLRGDGDRAVTGG